MKLQSKINVYSGIRFYTTAGLEVTKQIKDGSTTAFKSKKEADIFAREKRSYTYELRYTEAENKHKKIKIYGYAVPS